MVDFAYGSNLQDMSANVVVRVPLIQEVDVAPPETVSFTSRLSMHAGYAVLKTRLDYEGKGLLKGRFLRSKPAYE